MAQHSVHVSTLVQDPEHKKWALLHDAAEAYLSDVPKPVKPLLPAYEALEEQVLRRVADEYDLCWPMPDEVGHADLVALATEKRDVMGPEPQPWNLNVEPDPKRLEPMSPILAKRYFMEAFNELRGEGNAGARVH